MTGCETPECKITCEREGKWSSKPPTCERKTCGGFIMLSSTNPQATLTIPGPKGKARSSVDCTWVVVSSEQNELNIDFPGSFTSISRSRYNCANHFVELGLGSETTRICQTQRTYHRSFPNMMTIRFYSTDASTVTFKPRVSMVKDYYETSGTSALWSKRGRGSKRRKCEVNVNNNKQWPDYAPIVTTTANSALFPDEENILEELFSIYHVDENDGLKMKRFESFSIALLDQIESNVCASEIDDEDVDEDDDENMKVSEMSGRDSLLYFSWRL